ncbi:MAG: ComF family protein [Tannerellaceae bacterium]|nr:ComF family protein [Tannerellaceae bacterium]
MESMRPILTDLLHLFFPNLCLLCKKPLVREEELLCLHCMSGLPYTHSDKEKENPVYQLFTGKTDVQEGQAFLRFQQGNTTQYLVHLLKYYGNTAVGEVLGRLAACEWEEKGLFRDVDVMLPVPLHRRRRWTRGYNQAEYIARGIASVRPIPILPSGVLTRANFSTSQVHKQFFDRWNNTENRFRVCQPGLVRHKHILLVDDVVTSGATLSACANALLPVEGVRVSVFVLSVTR